jgi:hypothetical protein
LVVVVDKVEVLVPVLLEVWETDTVDVFELVVVLEENSEIVGYGLLDTEGEEVSELVLLTDCVIDGDEDILDETEWLVEIVSVFELEIDIVFKAVELKLFVNEPRLL